MEQLQVKDWSLEDVQEWLRLLPAPCSQQRMVSIVGPMFLDNEITGEVLLQLDEVMLVNSLQIQDQQIVKRLALEIEQLKQKSLCLKELVVRNKIEPLQLDLASFHDKVKALCNSEECKKVYLNLEEESFDEEDSVAMYNAKQVYQSEPFQVKLVLSEITIPKNTPQQFFSSMMSSIPLQQGTIHAALIVGPVLYFSFLLSSSSH